MSAPLREAELGSAKESGWRHDEGKWHRPSEKKSAMAKSMRRHQESAGKKHKGLYPGFAQDMWENIRRQAKRLGKHR